MKLKSTTPNEAHIKGRRMETADAFMNNLVVFQNP